MEWGNHKTSNIHNGVCVNVYLSVHSHSIKLYLYSVRYNQRPPCAII